jgi:hypothetical protein
VIKLCKELSFVLGWRDAWKMHADDAALVQADVMIPAGSGTDHSNQTPGDALDEDDENNEQDWFACDDEEDNGQGNNGDRDDAPAFFNSPIFINAADGAAEFVVTM